MNRFHRSFWRPYENLHDFLERSMNSDGETFVIGLELCPFARPLVGARGLRIAVCEATRRYLDANGLDVPVEVETRTLEEVDSPEPFFTGELAG